MWPLSYVRAGFGVSFPHDRDHGGDVIDAVGDGLGHLGIGEIMHPYSGRVALRLPFGAAVGVIADVLPLLVVNADDRLAGGQMLGGQRVDVAELAIAVGVLGALGDLGIGLQAVTHVAQQAVDKIGAGLMAQTLELASQDPGDLAVQRNGDIGSQRDSGSTNESNTTNSFGSTSVAFLRPPPGRRTRSDGPASPANSTAPAIKVYERCPWPRPPGPDRPGLTTPT